MATSVNNSGLIFQGKASLTSSLIILEPCQFQQGPQTPWSAVECSASELLYIPTCIWLGMLNFWANFKNVLCIASNTFHCMRCDGFVLFCFFFQKDTQTPDLHLLYDTTYTHTHTHHKEWLFIYFSLGSRGRGQRASSVLTDRINPSFVPSCRWCACTCMCQLDFTVC